MSSQTIADPVAGQPSSDGAGVWIALPTYNERDNLGHMVRQLLELLPGAQILIVDDNSPDGTGDLADHLSTADTRVAVFHRAGKEGLGAAYRAAFHLLRTDPDASVVVQMDCDFSHDPGDVPRLIAEVRSGADLAIGSRYVPGGGTPGWPLSRRLISRGGNGFARVMLGLGVNDLTGGFKAWRVQLLRGLDLDQVETHGYGFQIETTWNAHRIGAVIREVPIIFRERRAGQSKMTRAIAIEAFGAVVRLRRASRSSASPDLRPIVGLNVVRSTSGIAVDDLGAIPITRPDGPPDSGLPARGAGEAESGG
jgi:dolichol-phosphate mannosyltransferase